MAALQRLRSLSDGRRKPRILLCITGSVATVKVPKLAAILSEFAEVRIVGTESAMHFLNRAQEYDGEAYSDFKAVDPRIEVFSDQQEWKSWSTIGDPVMHIHLRNWADLLLVAPLSANTLGKLANGLCDNLATCVARAWDFELPKPFLVCPAMNTHMWNHPITKRQLAALQEMGIEVINPISKTLACGDTGAGAMADVNDIRARVVTVLNTFTEMARQNMPPPSPPDKGLVAISHNEEAAKKLVEKKEVVVAGSSSSSSSSSSKPQRERPADGIENSISTATADKRQKQAA